MYYSIKINGTNHNVLDLTWHDLADADHAGVDTWDNMYDQLWDLRENLIKKNIHGFLLTHVSHELLQI